MSCSETPSYAQPFSGTRGRQAFRYASMAACRAPGLAKRWAEEEVYARDAKASNESLVRYSRTRFKVGDRVLHEGRYLVEITEVQPVGFISVPRKYGTRGQLLEAVTADVEIYQFKALTAVGSPSGQTSVDRLSSGRPLPDLASSGPCRVVPK